MAAFELAAAVGLLAGEDADVDVDDQSPGGRRGGDVLGSGRQGVLADGDQGLGAVGRPPVLGGVLLRHRPAASLGRLLSARPTLRRSWPVWRSRPASWERNSAQERMPPSPQPPDSSKRAALAASSAEAAEMWAESSQMSRASLLAAGSRRSIPGSICLGIFYQTNVRDEIVYTRFGPLTGVLCPGRSGRVRFGPPKREPPS